MMNSDKKKILYHLLQKDIITYLQRYKNMNSKTIPIKVNKNIFNYKINFHKRKSIEEDKIEPTTLPKTISQSQLNEITAKTIVETKQKTEPLKSKREDDKTVKKIIPIINNADDKILQTELKKIETEIKNCTLCSLHKSRNDALPGLGSNIVKLVIIGDAPNREEDKAILPFAGEQGELLTKMLSAINISRKEIFICNIVKCRPPLNRDPHPEEIKTCSNYLDRQLALLKPNYILCLGRTTAMKLLKKNIPMKEFRETLQDYKGIPVQVSYHPAALIRNQKWKRPAWDDLKKLQSLLGV